MTKAWFIKSDTIFEIIGPENIGIDTTIKFLSTIVSNIRHFENCTAAILKKMAAPAAIDKIWIRSYFKISHWCLY